MEQLPDQDRAANLQELAGKSWNLELIISGAAIFLVSYLPKLIDGLLGYYLENLASDPELSKSALPILAYSFFKVVAWVLIGTFVVHFMLRAFWVGLVGLHAVYPEGIRYDQLPWQSSFSQKISQKGFGQLSDYIYRIDRLSNQIFSFAFLIAMMGVGISLIYLFLFLLTNPNVFPEWMGNAKVRSLLFLFLVVVVALLPAIAQFLSRHEHWLEKPWVRKLVNFSMRNVPALMLPLVYRPLTYINLIYTSNVSRKRLVTTLVLVTMLVMGGVLWVFVNTQMDLRGRDIFIRQDYFGTSNSPAKLFPRNYDSLRQTGDFMPAVSIESDIVEGAVLRVFISYRKWLDKSLEKYCATPEWPDSISRTARRVAKDSANLACLSNFLHITVNDSSYTHTDWLFYTHPETGTHGLLGYIPTEEFQTGKNVLAVNIPAIGNSDSLTLYGRLPFWFFGKNQFSKRGSKEQEE